MSIVGRRTLPIGLALVIQRQCIDTPSSVGRSQDGFRVYAQFITDSVLYKHMTLFCSDLRDELVPVLDDCYYGLAASIVYVKKNSVPSVESTIVPSKSERTPSKVWICGGAENDPSVMLVV